MRLQHAKDLKLQFLVTVMILLKVFMDRSALVTVNFLNIRTPKTCVVITLKFELCGSTIE